MRNELRDNLLALSADIKTILPLIVENPADLNLERMERKYIISAMKLCGGIKKDAAEKLGITIPTLVSRLRKHQILSKEYDCRIQRSL